jgi:GT2 family glycosyltransferase
LVNEGYFKVFIIIVDNNSIQSDFNNLREYLSNFSEIQLIRNEKNVGYFGGLNSGIERVNLIDTAFVVIGNNDIEFDNYFLRELHFFEGLKSDIYVLAPDIINLEGDHQNPVSVKRLSFIRRIWLNVYHFNYYIGIPIYYVIEKFREKTKRSSKGQIHTQIPITIAYGACYVLTNSFFLSFSKLDDRLFLYGEEALLSFQVRSAGGLILYSPNLIAHHAEHKSIIKVEPKTLYKVKKEAYKQYKEFL